MANEVFWSSIASDSQRTIVRAEILAQLGDSMALPAHPAIINAGDVTGTGTDTIRQRADSLNGAATLGTVTESGNWANSAYDTDVFTVAVAHRYIQFTISDLARMIQDGQLDAARFAAHMISALAMTTTDLIATQGATFSNTGINSGAALTVADLYTAAYELEARFGVGRGRKMAVLHPLQTKQLAVDTQFTQASNAASQDPRYQAMRKLAADAYVGYLPDIDCDVFKSFKVGNSGGKHLGSMFVRGGIAIATGTPQESATYVRSAQFGPLLFAEERDTTGPRSALRGNTYLGAAKWQEAGNLIKSPV